MSKRGNNVILQKFILLDQYVKQGGSTRDGPRRFQGCVFLALGNRRYVLLCYNRDYRVEIFALLVSFHLREENLEDLGRIDVGY